MNADRRGTMLLGAGALAGVLLAAISLVNGDTSEPALEDDVVAVVDGRAIPRARYERALAAVAADRRGGALAPTDRARVLERLIDEELLVGRAIELGLPARDPRVRNDLATSMIDTITARAEVDEPDEVTLRDFYDQQPGRFRSSPRFQVRRAFFSDVASDAEARARAAVRAAELPEGDPGALPLPDGALGLTTLTQRLGPTAARGVIELEPGQSGGPWRVRGGWIVARLVTRTPGDVPPFGTIREHVATEHARVRGEEELAAFFAERRAEAEIVMSESP